MGVANNSFKKRIIISIIWITVFSAICLNGFSQYKKNAVVLELAGKSYYYFDLSYERILSEKFHIGGGAGLGNIYSLFIWQYGKVLEYNFRFPIYGAYAFGREKHHAITEFGVTIQDECYSMGSSDINFRPFIAFGYELKGSNIIFRVTGYLFYVDKNESSPAFMPWGGVSIGVPF
jgi:hypothetical protein